VNADELGRVDLHQGDDLAVVVALTWNIADDVVTYLRGNGISVREPGRYVRWSVREGRSPVGAAVGGRGGDGATTP
jgi:hypothetical protein